MDFMDTIDNSTFWQQREEMSAVFVQREITFSDSDQSLVIFPHAELHNKEDLCAY